MPIKWNRANPAFGNVGEEHWSVDVPAMGEIFTTGGDQIYKLMPDGTTKAFHSVDAFLGPRGQARTERYGSYGDQTSQARNMLNALIGSIAIKDYNIAEVNAYIQFKGWPRLGEGGSLTVAEISKQKTIPTGEAEPERDIREKNIPNIASVYEERDDLKALYDRETGKAIDPNHPDVAGIPTIADWWEKYGKEEYKTGKFVPLDDDPINKKETDYDPFTEAAKYGYTKKDFDNDPGFLNYWKDKTPEELKKGLEARRDWAEKTGEGKKGEEIADYDPFTEAAKYGYTREDFANDPGFLDYWKDKTPEELKKGLEERDDWGDKTGVGGGVGGGEVEDGEITDLDNPLKDDPLYQELDDENRRLIDLYWKMLASQDEERQAKFMEALEIAKGQADPYFREKMRMVTDSLGRTLEGLAASLTETEKRLIRNREEIEEDLIYEKEYLTAEQTAELSRRKDKYGLELEDMRETAAGRGLSFSTIRNKAEERMKKSYEDIVESTERQYERQERGIEKSSERGLLEIAESLKTIKRQTGASKTQAIRSIEELLGSKLLREQMPDTAEFLLGKGGEGDITGTWKEDKAADILKRAQSMMLKEFNF